MKATVNGIEVEGTAREIHEYVEMTEEKHPIKMSVKMGKVRYTELANDIMEWGKEAQKRQERLGSLCQAHNQ